MPNQFTPIIERFEASYVPEPNSGCWLWMGGISVSVRKPRTLRPLIRNEGRVLSAYRFSYSHFVGPIPAGAMICHHCDVSLCVNPEHLYPGTAQTNAQDCVRRGRHNSQTDVAAARLRGRRLYEARITKASQGDAE